MAVPETDSDKALRLRSAFVSGMLPRNPSVGVWLCFLRGCLSGRDGGVSHAGTGRFAQIGVPHGVRVRLCLGHTGTKQSTTTARTRPTSILQPDFMHPGGIASMFDSVEIFGR
jgi:hypothetical protein